MQFRSLAAAALSIGALAAALCAATPRSDSARLTPANGVAGAGNAANAVALHEKTVSYLGRVFPVPYSWQVIDLSARPSTCVRFDMHAVYLGHPGADEDCPARGVGRRTGALLIEPQLTRASTTATVALDHRIAGEIDVTAPGLTITASYSEDDRPTVVNAITAAGLPQPAPIPQVTAPSGAAALPMSATQPDVVTPLHDSAPVEIVRGTSQVTGLGFDTCTAPSAGQMQAWSASPYNTVGIYIGGSERACAQSNLTAGWINARAQSGWHFMPLYVGWQAAWDSLTRTSPAILGKQSADDAVAQATGLGIGPGALLYYDMESYDNSSPQSAAALAFESAWTSELHARGYRSAIYSSASTGIADLVAQRGKIAEPDAVDIAHWNGIADADPGSTPADAWQTARAHQYLGGVDVSYGGVKMNVDDDYLSINLAQPPGSPSPSASPTAHPSPSLSASRPASPSPRATPTAPPGPTRSALPKPPPSAPFTPLTESMSTGRTRDSRRPGHFGIQ